MTPDPSTAFIENVTGDRDEVPAAGSRKPDSSEPWRYVCPECGGQVRSTSQMVGDVYRCATRDCRNRLERSELRDQKRDPTGGSDG